ncbi:MAG: hypothetical protein IPM59_06920 [Chloracidobacterium sp.]|nr:hypothetical protein [Chloracidobacterium sp.]
MRRTITISVSEDLHAAILDAARKRFYSSVSEYIRFLVRNDNLKPEAKPAGPPRLPRSANERIAAATAGSDL